MTYRISTQSVFRQILMGIRASHAGVVRAQEQIASGRRLLVPSDDPTGAARALSLARQLEDVARFGTAVGAGRTVVDAAGGALQEASTLLADARALVLQGLSGTLNDGDRRTMAGELELLRDQLLEIGNQTSGERYLFAGTETSGAPWQERTSGGVRRVVYAGNGDEQRVRIGEGVDVALGLPGSSVFGKLEWAGTGFDGLTGIAGGTTADQGQGYAYLTLRHDSTDAGNLASVGIALAGGGAGDTLLGPQPIVVDATARTVRLGNGPALPMPDPASAEYADFVVGNELGGELRLDLTGFTGAGYSGTVTGNGSISLDGTTFQPLAFTETDLELQDPATNTVLHVDTTSVRRAGRELVSFRGTVNAFDVLQGISDDLANADGLTDAQVHERLRQRLDELDRNLGNVQVGLGVLGSRSQRLGGAEQRLLSLDLQLQSLRSDVVDVDVAEVALDLARSDRNLQAAQASGVRLLQQSLLNYL